MTRARDVSKLITTPPSIYATDSEASAGYLTLSSASSTYLSQSSASSNYIPQSSPAVGFKNKIINGDFRIWQRGTSFSSGGYNADRWILQIDGAGATRSVLQQSFTPGNTGISGYEPQYFLRYNQSVAGSAASYNIIDQRIEDVRTLAGQTVTVSFWAKADSARTINSSIQQSFGTGGSAEVAGLSSGSINITTTWNRYSYTGTLASILGKTIGANSYAAFRINFPLNTTFTIDIWGVQVEKGSIATDFEERFIGTEIALCQRYYEKSYDIETAPGTNTGTGLTRLTIAQNSIYARATIFFKVPKRATPTMSFWLNDGTANQWRWDQIGVGSEIDTVTGNTPERNSVIFETNGISSARNNAEGHWVASIEL